MKFSKLKLLVIMLFIIGFGIIFSSNVEAFSIYPNTLSNDDVYGQTGHYCIQKGNYISLGQGKNPERIDYATSSIKQMDITVAYAAYIGLGPNELQEIIWSSNNNSGEKTALTNEEVIKYKKVYDGIFSKTNGNDIVKLSFDSNEIKVLVDQIGKTYTVGPYTLDLAVGNGSEAASILAEELKKTNSNFARFNGITGINGSDVQIIDENGQVISLPNFGQKFYLRFKPNNDGAILTTGNPIFKFWFLTNVTGTIACYSATSEVVKETNFVEIEEEEEVDGEIVTNVHYETNEVIKSQAPSYSWQQLGDVSPVTPQSSSGESKTTDTNNNHSQQDGGDHEGGGESSEEHKPYHSGKYDVDGKEIVQTSFIDGAPINIQIGGKVWKETPSLKVTQLDGRLVENAEDKQLNDERFAGIQVELYEDNGKFENGKYVLGSGGTLVATTFTDSNGKYRFYGKLDGTEDRALINGLKKYFVVFKYDGQRYQSTYYKQDLSGGYSNAKDVNRDGYNKRFERIYSNTSNYENNGWHKAFAMQEKIEKDNQDFVNYQDRALTYEDVYNKMLEEASKRVGDAGEPELTDYYKVWNKKNVDYVNVLDNEVKKWLNDLGVNNQFEAIKTFILDTLMMSTTRQDQAVYSTSGTLDRYVIRSLPKEKGEYNTASAKTVQVGETYRYLYYQYSDQARNVDYGLSIRPYNDLALQKDVFKATVLINGKKQEYKYSKKSLNEDGTWDIKARASDVLYNGAEEGIYRREVKPSEYLYKANEEYKDADADTRKNLQVYVTYRIAVKNVGQVNTKINEIVDYYDPEQYSFYRAHTGNSADDDQYKDNVSVSTSENQPDGRNSNKEELKQRNYNYEKLYFTGKDGKALNNDQILHNSSLMFLFVTFKVNTGDYDRVKLDQDIMNGEFKVGKRNIAEINSYSTYYAIGTEIPDRLDGDKTVINIIDNETTPAGLIDWDSTPGSLKNKDLNEKGDIITSESTLKDRQQDDTDKSPNIRLIIDQNNSDIRTLKGTVFEDERDQKKGDALIGDGKINGKTINGVTVQLVELVQEVEGDGIDVHSTGNYTGEKVWGCYSRNNNFETSKTLERYASGAEESRIIENGPGILSVETEKLNGNNGEYSFKSVPAGDFYIRFIYGDTDETVLSSQDNDVNRLLNTHGRNEKSYNGQDYKSTIYQDGITQSGSYNQIQAYNNFEKQNYYRIDEIDKSDIYNNDINNYDIYTTENVNNKEKKYYYDIKNSANNSDVSDAKDVYDYRAREIAYSKGYENETLVNYRAEVLASHERLATDNPQAIQRDMVNELMNNTYIVAQSGVINTKIELEDEINYGGNLNYVIDHINLGLVERPEAGLKLNKEIDNFSVILSNGRTLFNVSSNQSVGNLSFSKHDEHEIEYANDDKFSRISKVTVNSNIDSTSTRQKSAELLQVYIDDELMQGSTLTARYKLTVTNIGEVDYNTYDFYYKGNPGNEEDKTTTDAKKVIDYVSNAIRYDASMQSEDRTTTPWNITKAEDLIVQNENQNLVNKKYAEELNTYDTILTTDVLSQELRPGEFRSVNLFLSTVISSSNDKDQLTYNNLSEIVATSNSVGRRNVYSISGNQQMADQSLGKNGASHRDNSDIYTKEDRVDVKEIDADSAQEIKALPPTGLRNTFEHDIIIIIGTLSIVVIGTYILRKKLRY